MRRREFIVLVGGAAAWPVSARAQQAAIPVVGFLNPRAPTDAPQFTAAFLRGLKDTGFVEGDYLPLDNYSQPWQYPPTLRFKGYPPWQNVLSQFRR